MKIIREKHLVPIEAFPAGHEESIEVICKTNEISIINYNYRMIKMRAPCPILLVSDVIFDLHAAIRLYNEAVRYRKLFFTR